MRIDALNQVSQLYQANKPKKVSKGKENDTADFADSEGLSDCKAGSEGCGRCS